MKGRYTIYKWLIAIWLMCVGGAVSPALAYTQATQPSAWRTTPTFSTDMRPAYQFRSTSVYKPIVGQTGYTSGNAYSPVGQYGPNRMRRGIDDEEDDPSGDPIGTIFTPVGEPMILLVLAFGYIIWKKRKKIHEKFAYIRKKQ